MDIAKELEIQRYDDHRYYHHSRINQALHLYSALSFMASYIVVFFQPWLASLIAWHGMIPRQIGHFFFEPRDYDLDNDISHLGKENIKIGYNLERKRWLLSAFALIPIAGFLLPSVNSIDTWLIFTGNSLLALAIAAIAARSLYLAFVRNEPKTGLIWVIKLITDPFHDMKLYWKSPYNCLRGEFYDPGISTFDLKYSNRVR